jgi:hypothetical protein
MFPIRIRRFKFAMFVYVCSCLAPILATMGIGSSVAQGREYRNGVHPVPVRPCRCGKRWWGGYVQVEWCEPGYEQFELLRLGIQCMDTLPDFEADRLSLAWAMTTTTTTAVPDCTQSVLLPPASPAITIIDVSTSPSPVDEDSFCFRRPSMSRSRSRSPHLEPCTSGACSSSRARGQQGMTLVEPAPLDGLGVCTGQHAAFPNPEHGKDGFGVCTGPWDDADIYGLRQC